MRRQQPSTRAVTFKLAAALEKYESDVRTLVDTWLDVERYRRLQDELMQLRMYCASLPRLSVAWVAVLVSQAKLLQALASRSRAAATAPLQEHLAAVEGLRRRCLRQLGAQSVVLT